MPVVVFLNWLFRWKPPREEGETDERYEFRCEWDRKNDGTICLCVDDIEWKTGYPCRYSHEKAHRQEWFRFLDMVDHCTCGQSWHEEYGTSCRYPHPPGYDMDEELARRAEEEERIRLEEEEEYFMRREWYEIIRRDREDRIWAIHHNHGYYEEEYREPSDDDNEDDWNDVINDDAILWIDEPDHHHFTKQVTHSPNEAKMR